MFLIIDLRGRGELGLDPVHKAQNLNKGAQNSNEHLLSLMHFNR